MTDKSEFSLGVSVDPSSSFKPLPDWVAFDLCTAHPVPGGTVLLHNTLNGKRAMVKPEVYGSLVRSSKFKTIEQHATALIKANPAAQGQQEDIQKVFKTMLDSGIMVSAKKTCDRLKKRPETASDDDQAAAPVAAIITWERPQSLARLLESISNNCDTKKLHRLYVIDDSRKTENISQNQALVEKFAPSIKAPLQYFGQDEQRVLLNNLAKRLPEHEDAIRFLADQSRWVDHWTSGLSRNLALLLSCGRRLVMLDDDTVCDLYSPPQPKQNITFSDGPRQADFFATDADWASLHQPINPDPINRHMQCLGLTFSEALSVLGQNHFKAEGLENASALLVSELTAESQVLLTECGSLGCPGATSNTWLPFMAPASLKRMLSSTEKTTNALTHRKVWSGRNQPHFSPRANMSQITGFDNRQMLPPYLPILRGEDRLFGTMLDFIFPTSVTLDYPWSVPHLPIPERDWRNKDLRFKRGGTFPGFFFAKILAYKSICQSGSPTDRLSALSAWFIDLASAPNDSLIKTYRETTIRGISGLLQELTTLLSTAESAPVNWQNYLRNGITQLNDDLDTASREDFQVKGSPANMEGDDLIAFWKGTWASFAGSLTAWPEIRKAATELLMAEDSSD
jgi:hypothetical protein